MPKSVQVAIGILTEHRQGATHVLIARRKDDAVLGGYWELPGGKIEAGESPEQCLVREFEEELAIVVQPGEALAVIEFQYDHAKVRLHPFFCRRIRGEPVNRHVAEHRWIEARSLLDYQFPPANTELMRQVHARLTGTSAAS